MALGLPGVSCGGRAPGEVAATDGGAAGDVQPAWRDSGDVADGGTEDRSAVAHDGSLVDHASGDAADSGDARDSDGASDAGAAADAGDASDVGDASDAGDATDAHDAADGADSGDADAGVEPYQVTWGENHSCAWKRQGSIYCWGENDGGELGAGNTNATLVPVPVQGLRDVKRVAARGEDPQGHTCAVDGAGQLWCWGWNSAGQLGVGDTTNRSVPTHVSGLSNVVDVGVGYAHTCALDSSGAVYCWGSNNVGAVGNVDPDAGPNVPARLLTPADAVEISIGSEDGCLRTASGEVRCWGYNSYGEVGNGGSVPLETLTPAVMTGITDAWAISVGTSFSCVFSRSQGVLCSGLVGSTPTTTAQPIAGLPSDLVSFATNWFCAVEATGLVWCWGPIAPDYVAKAQVKSGLSDIVNASGMCAATATGKVLCTGQNNFGQLGDGTQNDSRTQPVQVQLP
jgi:hypothetical protein